MSLISRIGNKPYFLLILLLFLKAVFLILMCTYGPIGLSPDEAQYWTWSQKLDWGYFSKPPAIAWQIFLTTSLFGNNELGVRVGAIFIGFLLPLVVYRIAKDIKLSGGACFWSAFIMAYTPLGFYVSFAATTDPGSILFLTLAVSALVKKEAPNLWLAGLFIFFGALYKWTAFSFWLFLLPCLFFLKYRKSSLLGSLFFSLLALIPVIFWNASHDWATFKHVGSGTTASNSGNFLDFLAAQMALLSPIYFILYLIGLLKAVKSKNEKLYVIIPYGAGVLLLLSFSLFKKMQPNWAAFLYPPSLILIAHAAYPKAKGWLRLGAAISSLLIAISFFVPWAQEKNFLNIPYKWSPFRHSMGWKNLPGILKEVGYEPKRHFLFGDKYQTASILSFYSPERKRAYFFNLSGTRKNQFSYWPGMEQKEKAGTGYFVILENMSLESAPWYEKHYLQRLSPFFEKVEYLGAFPLFYSNDTPVKFALIFKATDYSGKALSAIEKY